MSLELLLVVLLLTLLCGLAAGVGWFLRVSWHANRHRHRHRQHEALIPLAQEAEPLSHKGWITNPRTLEGVVEATGLGIWEWNIETGETAFNARWAEIIGYTPEELNPVSIDTWSAVCHPEDFELSRHKAREHCAGRTELYCCDMRMRHKAGHYVWVRDTGRVVEWNKQGEPCRMVGTHLDITEQKKTQQELVKLSRIARDTKNGVIVASSKGHIEWVNEGFTRITGYPADEVIGKKPGDFLQGPQTDVTTRQAIAAAIAQEQPFCAEILNYTKQGKPYWIAIECSPIKSDSGTLEGFMAIESDITEQKANEDRIRHQAQALEQMSEHGRIGAWSVDLQTEEVYWSPITRVIHEVDRDYRPALASGIEFYKEGESRELIKQLVKNGIEEGVSWSRELQLVTAKGREIWVVATGQPEFKEGRCVRLFGSFQDIDERKRHQLQSRYALALSETLVGLTVHPDVIEGEIQVALSHVVKVCAQVLQVDRTAIWRRDEETQTLRSESVYELAKQRFRAGDAMACSQVAEFTRTLSQVGGITAPDATAHPALASLKDGYITPKAIRSAAYTNIVGGKSSSGFIAFETTQALKTWSAVEQSFMASVATLIASVYDRYQLKKTEWQLREAILVANSATEAKSSFLASMSHEIRTPMNAILGMLGSALKKPLEDEQRRKIDIARKSAKSLLSIINDILDFSKLEADKCELEEIPFNLKTLLIDLAETFNFEVQAKDISLRLDTQGLEHAFVIGDPGRFRQILTNLLGNAIKFTPTGGITIAAKTEIDAEGELNVVVRIVDSGIGIPAEKLRDLFQAFTQVDASTTRQYGGTGLGLSIVKGLCESMGGGVVARSKEGKGSTFIVSVAMKQDHNPTLLLPTVSLSGCHVLLVGIPRSASFTESFCDRIGFVTQLETTEAFKHYLKDNVEAPDIVVIADTFESPNAIIMGRQAKTRFAHAHTVMMFDEANHGDALKAAAAGFSGFIPSSITAEDFTRVVEVLVDGSLLPYAKPLVTKYFVTELYRAEPAQLGVALPAFEHTNAKLLLVEDSDINQEVAIDMLKDIGLQADVVSNGQEALALLQQPNSRYDLILMDCQMPVMDGFETTAAIRAGEAGEPHLQIPIIALTANAIQGDREICLKAGFDDYLSKPMEPEDLERVIVQWLSQGAVARPHALVRESTFAQENAIAPESTIAHVNTTAQENTVTEAHVERDMQCIPETVWDLSSALRRVRGREDRLLKLITSYQAQQAGWMVDVHSQVDTEDLNGAAKVCHTLQGVAGNLGGIELTRMAQSLELTCRENDRAKACELVAELEHCNTRFVELLADYQQRQNNL